MSVSSSLYRSLLLGSAVAVFIAGMPNDASAQTVEIGNGAADRTVVSGVGINNGDQIVDDVDDTNDVLSIDANGTTLSVGTDAVTSGVVATGAGDADASSIYFTNTQAGAGSIVLENNASGVAVLTDGANTNLTLEVGDASDTTDAAGDVSLTIDGDIVTATGGQVNLIFANDTDTSENYNVIINGSADLGAGAVTFNNVTDSLTIGGTGAKSFSGAINATADGDGSILASSTGGTMTFNDAIGAAGNAVGSLSVYSNAADVSAEFFNDVFTNFLYVGDGAGTENNSIGFNSTSSDIIVGGAVTGGAATQNNTISVTGGNTVTLQSSSGTNIDALTVAADTTLALGANEAASGGDNSVTYTGDITGGGTLVLNGDDFDATGHTVAGSVGTSGTPMLALRIDNDNADTVTSSDTHTITGNLYATTLTFAASDDAASNTVGGTLILNSEAGNATVQIASVTSGLDGDGTLSLAPGGSGNTLDATITGDVGAAALAVAGINIGSANGVATLTAQGNLYTTAINLDAGSTLNLHGTSGVIQRGSNVTETFGINGADADGEGTISVGDGTNASAYTVNGEIGAAFDLALIDVNNNASLTVTDNVGLTAADGVDALSVDTGATFVVNSTTNTVDVIATDGNLDFDGTFNITGGANNVIIQANDNLDIDGTFSSALTTGNVTLTSSNDLMTIGANTDTSFTTANQIVFGSAAVTLGGTGRDNTLLITRTDNFDPTDTAVFEGVTNSTVVNVATDGVWTIALSTASQDFNDGDAITIIDGGVNATTSYLDLLANGDIVLQDTLFLDLDGSTSTTTDLIVTINNKSGKDVLSGTGINAADSILGTNVETIDGTLQAIRASLLDQTNAKAASEIAEATVPTVDAGAMQAGMNAVTRTGEITSSRLASLRGGGSHSGMTAGTIAKGLKVWGQGFGSFGEQDAREGVDGYDFTTYGMAVGMDTETLIDGWVWGIGASYSQTNVDSDNANATETEVDTLQLTLYAEHELDKDTYINGQLAFAMGDTETTRKNVGGLSGVTAFGTFDTEQYIARLEAGRHYRYGNATQLTPKVLMNYVNYSADEYVERGAGNASLTVNQDDLNVLELGVGIDASWLYQDVSGAFLKPEIGAGVRHDLIGDKLESTANFAGARQAAFKTEGADPAQTTFNLHGGVTYFSTSNWDFASQYDFEYKEDYMSHSALVKATYKF